MQASGLAYKIAFSLLRGMNATTAGEMLRRLGSPEEFFRLDARSLRSRMGVKSDLADSEYRSSLLEIAVSEAEFIADNNVRSCFFTDQDYPRRLRECADAPVMLY